ncbi:hypothetical protein [Mycolicibacterium holsaticum]|uniref:Uncharacterized protein n=1 Tax=Mycolicibacterium holsaticum TaxID=152142 RepID=A0A1E3R706_9MYCO|nr:hypothetical protein [Mycolicibacterium holsaticum]ODQ85521.1 hypothetical protein BHQ17_23105 [Mycolicibacterium holsaticum]
MPYLPNGLAGRDAICLPDVEAAEALRQTVSDAAVANVEVVPDHAALADATSSLFKSRNLTEPPFDVD